MDTLGRTLRNALQMGLLFLACLVGLQVSLLIRQAAEILNAQHGAALAVFTEAQSTMALARASLAEQQGYYRDSARHIKALTRTAAIDAVRFGRFIENMDMRLERLTLASERALGSVESATESIRDQTEQVGNRSAALLEEAADAVSALDRLAADPALAQSLQNLEASSANLATTTAAAAEAAGHVRDMLSPAKKSFWRRLLELLIPRPTVRVN